MLTVTAAWNDVNIEMIIYAPSMSSGSLIRLIRSLERADYLGSVPSLTIELPQHVEPELLNVLRDLKWPSPSSSKVTVRRRVQAHDTTPAESSAWTTESFYPRDPNTNHVLVLSPQAELAPSFYHYLKYTILKYKHECEANSKLLGISLDLPTSNPTADDAPFSPPSGKEGEPQALPHFLWQAPNSNAALYFGDKWAEFHSFLSHRLAVQETKPEMFPPEEKKLVSKRYPAFMELLLELSLARGYSMLYPSFIFQSTLSLAKAHEDLYQPPDEFLHDASSLAEDNDVDSLNHDDEPLPRQSIKKPVSTDSTLATFLDGFSVALPRLSSLDLLSFSGEVLSKDAFQHDTEEHAKRFQARYGACCVGAV